jgi:hypothetical protein
MPEGFPNLMVEATAGAFFAAVAIALLCGWPWRTPGPVRASVGAVVGCGIGFYAGAALLGSIPHWSSKEDQGRFLLVLFPAVLLVEIVAAIVRRPRMAVWLLRAAAAAGAARVLLHGSIYVTEPSDADTTERIGIWQLAALAAGLAIVWAVLLVLMSRAPGRSVPLSLALTTAGAAVTLMLSGYLTGGMLGLPLAASLAGVAAGSLALPKGTDLRGTIGPGVVGLFSLVVIGHFFGELTVGHAVLLISAPLLCWLPELVPSGRILPWLRALARVTIVALPVALVAAQAGQKFVAASQPATGEDEASADDYANYGK